LIENVPDTTDHQMTHPASIPALLGKTEQATLGMQHWNEQKNVNKFHPFCGLYSGWLHYQCITQRLL